MKYLLFGNHDNRPGNKYFLLRFAYFGLKTTTALNARKNYRYKDSTLKLNGMIDLFIRNLQNYFLGRENPIVRRQRWKIWLKMEKCSKFIFQDV